MNISKKTVRAVLENTPTDSLLTSTKIRGLCDDDVERVPDALTGLALYFGPTSWVKIVESKKSSGYRRLISMEKFEKIFQNFPDEAIILGKKIREEVLSSAADREKTRVDEMVNGNKKMTVAIEGEGIAFRKQVSAKLFGPIVTYIENAKDEI